MKNYRKVIEQIAAAGLDVYSCRDPQGVTLLVNKQKKRIYICSYAADVTPSLLSIGPVLLNPESKQPRNMGSEYGVFINEDDETAQTHFRGFMESVIADIELKRAYASSFTFPLNHSTKCGVRLSFFTKKNKILWFLIDRSP